MDGLRIKQNLSERTTLAIREVLDGRGRLNLASALLFAGPAVIASSAYMDPGNFATNIQAGAKFGYSLLWVVVIANLIAMLFQALSAKLGIVTGRNLAQMCREQLPQPIVMIMWIISEIAAMATDLAEFLGGAIGISLLFHIGRLPAMGITALLTYCILLFEKEGFRPLEIIIGCLVSIIGVCYLIEIFIAPISWRSAVIHSVWPEIPNAEALTIAVGIIGATIMPHALYLHSGLTQDRVSVENDLERAKLLHFSNAEVVTALTLAGMVNMAIVMTASSAFHAGHKDVAEIETAYHTLSPLLGKGAASVFLISLIVSGISSSAVGTMAGQMIVQGFVSFSIPVWLRRLITMVPAFIVIGMGINATTAMVISQVVLSIALPLPMITLVWFTSRPDIMGAFCNSWLTKLAAITGTAVVIVLNSVLLLGTLGLSMPGGATN